MIGAIAELDASRKVDFFGGTTPWWVFYLAGAVFLVVLPIFVARGVRWLTAALAFFTALKAGYLFWRIGREFRTFELVFALVAATATVLLIRALGRKR